MKNVRWLSIASANSAAVLVAFSLCLLALGNDRGDLRKRASWSLPTRDEVQAQVDAWLTEQSSSSATREEVAAIWSADGPQGESDLLERVVASIAVVEPRAGEVAARMQPGQSAEFAKFAWLRVELTPPFVRFNLRLAYGRWLSQQGYFDESLEELGGLLPDQVVDPGALLFYQSVAYHKLLKKEECLAALD